MLTCNCIIHACHLQLACSHMGTSWAQGAGLILFPWLCSAAGAYVVANGEKALNMVSFNFLGVAGDTSIKV